MMKASSRSTHLFMTLDCCVDMESLDMIKSRSPFLKGRNIVMLHLQRANPEETGSLPAEVGALTQAINSFGFECQPFGSVLTNLQTAVTSQTRGACQLTPTASSLLLMR